MGWGGGGFGKERGVYYERCCTTLYKVTQDFVRYLRDKMGGEEDESRDQEDQERHDDEASPPPPYDTGADKVVWRDDGHLRCCL